MIKILKRISPHDPHGILASCCIRLLHQFSNSKSIVKSIAAAVTSVKPMATLKKTMMPMHKDAGFTLETIRCMLDANSKGNANVSVEIGGAAEHASALVQECLDSDVDMIKFLTTVLDGTAEGIDRVGSDDFSICKVHTVEIIHTLEADPMYGPEVRSKLDGYPVWEEYRHQKHDLFMSKAETNRQDYYLTYGKSISSPS